MDSGARRNTKAACWARQATRLRAHWQGQARVITMREFLEADHDESMASGTPKRLGGSTPIISI